MRRLHRLALLLAAAPALAHVAPSPDADNRYLKATLLPGEVRLSFIYFAGERRGADERRRADTDGDGRLGAPEAQALGERLRAELAPGLRVVLDGRELTGWTVSDVGLGGVGGALSIDLTLIAPVEPANSHTLVLEDGTAVATPGESETFVEDGPGVRLAESHLAGVAAGVELDFVFTGNADPAAPGARAVQVRFTVDTAGEPRRRVPWGLVAIGLVGVLLAAALRWRRRPT